ncbi:MAG: helix-turn-helix transcriptional regulator [Prosthecobacter sp.]
MAWMEFSADGHAPDDQAAIRILSAQLSLTRRQAEVLHWVAEGKSNDEIATILGCSINTVKAHLKDIFRHLGLHSRTAAAASAYRAHIYHARGHPALPARVIPERGPRT